MCDVRLRQAEEEQVQILSSWSELGILCCELGKQGPELLQK